MRERTGNTEWEKRALRMKINKVLFSTRWKKKFFIAYICI